MASATKPLLKVPAAAKLCRDRPDPDGERHDDRGSGRQAAVEGQEVALLYFRRRQRHADQAERVDGQAGRSGEAEADFADHPDQGAD